MSLKLSISDIIEESETESPKLLRIILENIARFQEVRPYSEYAPNLDFSNPKSRRLLSKTLGDLWTYCSNTQIPLLNMLVVLKKDRIPSTGIESWYKSKFKTLKKYDEYCKLHAQLAEFILKNAIIVLVD